MKRIFYYTTTAIIISCGITQAQTCVPTPTCSTLGYTSTTACDGGLKCPFGNYWNCDLANKITELTNKITEQTNKITEIETKVEEVEVIVTRPNSALKFCALASGEVDIYPRFNGSSEWDSAAGDLIVRESGGMVLSILDKRPLKYNKPDLRNPHFIAFGKNQIGGEIYQKFLTSKDLA